MKSFVFFLITIYNCRGIGLSMDSEDEIIFW